ncbi:MAG: SDR family oxidoreductase [Chloroflexi bacterium]|nr:SDR family oxidoreductase [Chloroflexota bacterium]
MSAQTIGQLFDLTGKGAIVTGGGEGIGKAIAFRLAEAGAGVMISDLNIETAKETAKHIRVKGGKAATTAADATSLADARRVVMETIATFGCLDVFINNAGIYPAATVLDMTVEAWDSVHDTNLRSVFFYSQAAAQQMIKAGHGGKIINIASLEALHPSFQHAHYAASKGGVVALTKALALELAPHRIMVNAIAPGIIKTRGLEELLATLMPTEQSFEEKAQLFLPRVPLYRVGEPDDVAKVALFLASAAADYITGETIVVDGGYLLS